MFIENIFELPGFKTRFLDCHPDERGFFCEILRRDWEDFLDGDSILQVAVSQSHPGVVRAWHRHTRGQVDYLVVLQGRVRVVAVDGWEGSGTRGKLAEVVISGERPQVTRIPGNYWHGTKSIGDCDSLSLYFFNRLYDYSHPDEERLPAKSENIIDPRTGLPFDWNTAL